MPAQNSLEVDDPRDRHEIPRHEIKKVSVPCSPSCVKSNLVLVSTICYLVFFLLFSNDQKKKKKKKNANFSVLHVVERNSLQLPVFLFWKSTVPLQSRPFGLLVFSTASEGFFPPILKYFWASF